MTWHLLLRRSYGVRLVPVMLLMWWYGAFGNPPARSAIERAQYTLRIHDGCGACCAEYLLGTSEIYRRSDSKEIIQAVSAENCGAVVGN